MPTQPLWYVHSHDAERAECAGLAGAHWTGRNNASWRILASGGDILCSKVFELVEGSGQNSGILTASWCFAYASHRCKLFQICWCRTSGKRIRELDPELGPIPFFVPRSEYYPAYAPVSNREPPPLRMEW